MTALVSPLVSEWAARIQSPVDVVSTDTFFTAADGVSAWIVTPLAGRVVTLADEVRGSRRTVVSTNDVEVVDRYLVALFARLAIGPAIQLPDAGAPIALAPAPATNPADEPLVALHGPEGLWAQTPVSRAAELRFISGLVRYTTAQLDEYFRAQLA